MEQILINLIAGAIGGAGDPEPRFIHFSIGRRRGRRAEHPATNQTGNNVIEWLHR
jgi:hypothetical protein